MAGEPAYVPTAGYEPATLAPFHRGATLGVGEDARRHPLVLSDGAERPVNTRGIDVVRTRVAPEIMS